MNFVHTPTPAGRVAGIGTGRFVPEPRRGAPPPPPRLLARTRSGTLGDLGLTMTVANSATPSPGSNASSYAEWLSAVKAAGGVATALNGVTAARYPIGVTIGPRGTGEWGKPDSFTAAGDWAYYYAPESVDRSAAGSVQATPSEIAKGAGELEAQWWKGPVKAIGVTIAGAVLVNFLLNRSSGR